MNHGEEFTVSVNLTLPTVHLALLFSVMIVLLSVFVTTYNLFPPTYTTREFTLLILGGWAASQLGTSNLNRVLVNFA